MPALAKTGAGNLTELLTIQTVTPVAIAVTSITRTSTTATVTTTTVHGFTTGDYVTHAGAVETDYNIEAQVTVTNTTVYTYQVANSPTTPATGTITATYTSDASGGQQGDAEAGYYTLATVWGSVTPLNARELLQAQSIGSAQTYKGRIYYRADVTPKMRIAWTPYMNTAAKSFEVHGVQPDPDEPRRFLVLHLEELI